LLLKLTQLFTLKIFEKEEERRLARIQINMMLLFLFFSLLSLVINFLTWKNPSLTSIIILGYIFHLIPLGLIFKKKLYISSFFLTGLYTTVAISIATVGGGLHDYIVMLFPIIIMFASLTAQKRGLIFSSLLTLAGITWLTIGEIAGWFIVTVSHFPNMIDLLMAFILVFTLTWLANLSITHSRYGLTQTWQELGERKRLEAELRKLSRAVEQNPSSIVITNLDGQIEYVNPRFTEITGYAFEEVVQKNPRILKTSMTMPDVHQLLWKNLLAGKEWRGEFINHKKDGSIYYESAVIAPIFNEDGSPSHYLGIKDDITQLRKNELALRASEARFRALFKQNHDGVFIIGLDGRTQDANQRAAEMLGYSIEELKEGKDRESLASPNTPSENSFARVLAGEHIPIFERMFRKKDGSTFPVEINLELVHDEDGTPLHVQSIIRDITERKQTEQALHEKKQELDRFFSTSLDLLCIADTEGFFRRLNLEWENTLGYSLDELQSRQFLDFVHPEDLDSTLDAISQLESQQSIINFENRFRCKDGSYRWIEWRSKTFGKNIYAAARDVTKRRKIEEALRESEKRYRSLFNQTHDAVFILDMEGRHLQTNQRAADLLGYSLEEIKNLSVYETSGDREASIQTLERLKAGEIIRPYEQIFRKKDGQLLPVEINLELVCDEVGLPIHIQSVVRDITLRKQHETDMQAANEQLQKQLLEIQSLQEALREQALRDSLTGLYNRHYLEEIMPKEIARAQRSKKNFSVVILDLDNLKTINDTYGHIKGGDQAIKTLADTLKHMSRKSDILFRYAGDEFLILLYDTPAQIAFRRVNQWLNTVQKISIIAENRQFSISFSAGIAEFSALDTNGEDILIRADQALYQAKQNGRNQTVLWSEKLRLQ
jgi:diguanylate cyclase (GGDEF)-like protein/PAS domain S-box-containing protein